MPPTIDDEEMESDIDAPDLIPAKAKPDVDEAAGADDEEDEEEDDGEYQVEKIMKHKLERGKIIYLIKWLGYDEEEDLTWEPVANLSGSKDILDAYHIEIGGTPEPPSKGAKGKKGTKRTASTAFEAPESGNKRGARKSETNGAATWEPPLGTWDDDITCVAAIIEDDDDETAGKRAKTTKTAGELGGLLQWRNGKKTQHKMSLLRKKCPQRLLDYYEQHLVFKGDSRIKD